MHKYKTKQKQVTTDRCAVSTALCHCV